ncbi:response regulator transcription factor [Brevibacillus daliensis]|uniref:response regulator transcription factor n=1 Tax=Brevibacillus daliensis TaxID=2892995 RepID=UPI001E634075|nr:response regulator transcription factor [Brevibacillus daliensis]
MNRTILIADDEEEIVELLTLYLEKEGFRVIATENGEEAWQIIQNEAIDLALLDIMIPKLNGLQLITHVRKELSLPVIFLSARSQDHDVILGLTLGADDYITKPFNPLEVVARIKAQLRRSYHLNLKIDDMQHHALAKIIVGELVLHKEQCALYRNQKEITLTFTEYKLLQLFMEQPNRVFTKKQIFESVWGDEYYSDDNTIMVHISKLREKIEKDPKKPCYLKTVRGLGYKLVSGDNKVSSKADNSKDMRI